MSTIPTTIEAVTADWMSAATGMAITSVSHERIGVGIGVSSAVYRSTLSGTDVPTTVIVKLPALAEEAVFTATMLGMYIREVRFFEEMAADSPIRVPAGIYGAVDEETSHFVLIMEDLGDMRMIDQTEGMDIVDAETAVDELATWHATFWGKGEALAASGAAVSLDDPIYPAVLPIVFAEGWELLLNHMAMPGEIEAVGSKWITAMPQLLQDLVSGPSTALHGDYRGDNIMFAGDGSLVLLDFQLTGHGSGSYDLAYFITQSLRAETAAEHEQALFERWVGGLIANGVAQGETTDLWEQYRKAAFICLAYPVVASRGMDLEDPRQRALIDTMTTRFARAAQELDLAAFV